MLQTERGGEGGRGGHAESGADETTSMLVGMEEDFSDDEF
jgi:hypothetical protein